MEKVVSNPFGRCMMCHKDPIEVRHINLYLVGSEGFWCCRACEDKVLDFIREESRKVIQCKVIQCCKACERRERERRERKRDHE